MCQGYFKVREFRCTRGTDRVPAAFVALSNAGHSPTANHFNQNLQQTLIQITYYEAQILFKRKMFVLNLSSEYS